MASSKNKILCLQNHARDIRLLNEKINLLPPDLFTKDQWWTGPRDRGQQTIIEPADRAAEQWPCAAGRGARTGKKLYWLNHSASQTIPYNSSPSRILPTCYRLMWWIFMIITRQNEFMVRKGSPFFLILSWQMRSGPARSAGMEAMQEQRVTIGDTNINWEEPFLVLATQNSHWTGRNLSILQTQVDRFMLKVVVGYINKTEEQLIIHFKAPVGMATAPSGPYGFLWNFGLKLVRQGVRRWKSGKLYPWILSSPPVF